MSRAKQNIESVVFVFSEASRLCGIIKRDGDISGDSQDLDHAMHSAYPSDACPGIGGISFLGLAYILCRKDLRKK